MIGGGRRLGGRPSRKQTSFEGARDDGNFSQTGV